MVKTVFFASIAIAFATLPAAARAADAKAGEALFKQQCGICHSVVDDTGPRPAPSLKGVVGRKAATVPGFNYSSALKGSGLVWTAPDLDKWLTNPSAMVPGTFMVISVPNPAQRQNVVAYLQTLKGSGK